MGITVGVDKVVDAGAVDGVESIAWLPTVAVGVGVGVAGAGAVRGRTVGMAGSALWQAKAELTMTQAKNASCKNRMQKSRGERGSPEPINSRRPDHRHGGRMHR